MNALDSMFPAFDEFVSAAKSIQTSQPAQITEAAERLQVACLAFEKMFKDFARAESVRYLSRADMRNLVRFMDCCEDSDSGGHDVSTAKARCR